MQLRGPLQGGSHEAFSNPYNPKDSLYIVELGKRLVHYKILRQVNQHATTVRLIGVIELLTYLKTNEGELMH
jgi:hypothetical protein